MRSYPSNSPPAAARIVALAMLGDGHVCKAEFEELVEQGVPLLGLPSEELFAVVHSCCDDLLPAAELSWLDACRIDSRTLARLMAEVDDPQLRLKVLGLCISVVDADGFVAEWESAFLVAAADLWGLQHAVLRRPAAMVNFQHA